MKLFKVNGLASMFLAFLLVFITYIIVTDENIQIYEQVEIEHGDTLWSLAKDYSGKMTMRDWIYVVKEENHLRDEHIVAGQTIIVPVEKTSQYIVQKSTEQQIIKVASEK